MPMPCSVAARSITTNVRSGTVTSAGVGSAR
jgi:hypothetical protein